MITHTPIREEEDSASCSCGQFWTTAYSGDPKVHVDSLLRESIAKHAELVENPPPKPKKERMCKSCHLVVVEGSLTCDYCKKKEAQKQERLKALKKRKEVQDGERT